MVFFLAWDLVMRNSGYLKTSVRVTSKRVDPPRFDCALPGLLP